jgi:hypothetical protein
VNKTSTPSAQRLGFTLLWRPQAKRGAADRSETAAVAAQAGGSIGYNKPVFGTLKDWKKMAKAYWVVCYRSITDSEAREKYTKLAVPAVLAAGGAPSS